MMNCYRDAFSLSLSQASDKQSCSVLGVWVLKQSTVLQTHLGVKKMRNSFIQFILNQLSLSQQFGSYLHLLREMAQFSAVLKCSLYCQYFVSLLVYFLFMVFAARPLCCLLHCLCKAQL